ncbi:MAG: hypothetical protein GY794_12580 [bacterium]|nr:hypothetical protein [bacterium]
MIHVTPVIAEFDNVLTTRSLLPAALSAVVTDADDNLVSIDWLWLSDDIIAPAGAVGTITNTTSDLYAPRADFGAPSDPNGGYIIRLTATDGDGNTAQRNATVQVFETACELAATEAGWSGYNYYDRDEDCDVDLNDYAVFAAEWLDDINATDQH